MLLVPFRNTEYRFNLLRSFIAKIFEKVTALFLPAFRVCASIDILLGFTRLHVSIHDIRILHPIWFTSCMEVSVHITLMETYLVQINPFV